MFSGVSQNQNQTVTICIAVCVLLVKTNQTMLTSADGRGAKGASPPPPGKLVLTVLYILFYMTLYKWLCSSHPVFVFVFHWLIYYASTAKGSRGIILFFFACQHIGRHNRGWLLYLIMIIWSHPPPPPNPGKKKILDAPLTKLIFKITFPDTHYSIMCLLHLYRKWK